MSMTSEQPASSRKRLVHVSPLVTPTDAKAPDIYLIHGTWADGVLNAVLRRKLTGSTGWSDGGSKFVVATQGQYPGSGIYSLTWGSRNRESDRKRGAAELRNELRKDLDKPKIIICHSHGGNLVMDTLRDGDHGVKAVVCMNSPFFASLRRNTSNAFEAAFILLVLGGLSWVVTAPGSSLVWFGCLWGISLVLAVVKALPYLKRKTKDYPMLELDSKIRDCRFLCLTTREDEAFYFLNLADSIGNIPFLLLGKWSPWVFWILAMVTLAMTPLQLLKLPSIEIPLLSQIPALNVWSGILVAAALTAVAALIRKHKPEKLNAVGFALVAVSLTAPWWLQLFGLPWDLGVSYLVSGLAWASLAFALILLLTFPAVVFSRFLAQGIADPIEPYFVRRLVTMTPLQARHVSFVEFEPNGHKSMNHAMLHEDAGRTLQVIKEWMDGQRST